MNTDNLFLIRKHAFFAGITDEEFEQLDLHHRYKEAAPGEYIYFDAQEHRNLYFLKDGYVKIGYINQHGQEVIREIIGNGDVFGQLMLEPNNLQGEFAQAFRQPVSICMFRVADFERLLTQKPGLAIRYAKQVGEKLVRVENKMVNLLHGDVRHRLLYFLAGLMPQGETMADGSVAVNLTITHADIASLIASTRQTVTSLLGQLEKEGTISFSRKLLLLRDPKKLLKQLDVG